MSTAAGIHPTAIVAESARIGENVTIGPYAVIEDDVIIGEGCRIGSHAVVGRHTRMGKNNRIFAHAYVGGEPQDLKFQGETTYLEIGDTNTIREFATVHRGTEGGGGTTRIGDNNLLMAYIHVAHDCQLGNSIVMSNGATLAGHVSVGDFAIIGGLSAAHQFIRIGRHAFVGGMTGIPRDMPPWMLAAGSRALVSGPNLVGLRRVGAGKELLRAMKEAFRLVWRSKMLRVDALAELEKEFGELPEIQEFIEFVRTSERGLLPGGKTEKEDS